MMPAASAVSEFPSDWIYLQILGQEQAPVRNAVAQGVDPRDEAFTASRFYDDGSALLVGLHPDELPLLLRRLIESRDPRANPLITLLVRTAYGLEVYT